MGELVISSVAPEGPAAQSGVQVRTRRGATPVPAPAMDNGRFRSDRDSSRVAVMRGAGEEDGRGAKAAQRSRPAHARTPRTALGTVIALRAIVITGLANMITAPATVITALASTITAPSTVIAAPAILGATSALLATAARAPAAAATKRGGAGGVRPHSASRPGARVSRRRR